MKQTFEQHLQHSLKELERRGVHPAFAAPILWRLFWRGGLEIPPPLYLSAKRLSKVFFLTFAIPTLTLTLFTRPLLLNLLTTLMACGLLATALTAIYRGQSAPFGKLDWERVGVSLPDTRHPNP